MIFEVAVLTFLALLLTAMIVIIFLLLLLLLDNLTTEAPFVPAPTEILPAIVAALDIKEGGVVYDLGCGDGRVLAACYEKHPRAKYFGIEKGIAPWWLAKWRLRKLKNDKAIRIIRQDFFKQDLSGATHIFLYLFPGLMDKLLPKLESELPLGARVISCSFKFSQKKPNKTIDLHRPKTALGRELHVYEF